MGEHRAPDDAELHWPVERDELDELPTLELAPDEAGRLAWHNMRPPSQDTYRAWMSRRQHATSASDAAADVYQDDPVMSLFASEAPASEPDVVRSIEPPTPTPLVGWAEPALMRSPLPRTEPVAELPLTVPTVATGVAATTSTSMRFWSTAVAAPLRLSLALSSAEARRPVSAPPPPGLPTRSRLEQLALLGTGAVCGALAALAVTVMWTPGGRRTAVAVTRPDPVKAEASKAEVVIPAERLPIAMVPLARPVPRGARLATLVFPAGRPAATSSHGAPASSPVIVAAAHTAAPAASSRHAEAPPRRAAAARNDGNAVARTPPAPKPVAAPPDALAAVGRFAAAYNRMDATATQAVWPSADHQALVTTFTALREQRLTLSGCRGTVQGDTAAVMCRGTLRYRPRVGNHDTRTLAGTWRFTMLQRADDWVVDGVETPDARN